MYRRIVTFDHNINKQIIVYRQVSEQFKEAIIRPLLKKQNSDIDELKNYHPVSNLNFISKIVDLSAAFDTVDQEVFYTNSKTNLVLKMKH